ncbi:DUF4345 domain-containing protein [Mycobacterium sp. LTG2003]
MTIRILKALGWVVGVVLVMIGVGRMVFPIETIPGGGAVNASVDTETRTGGALLVGFGAAYIWAVRQAVIPSGALRFLASIMALLVVARVISMIDAGPPHPVFIAFTIVEFIAASLTYWYSTMRDGSDHVVLREPAHHRPADEHR